jgi:putative ABC transport system ATP-binding protein
VVHALYDASLHVRPQEFVAICGPSGSGKTTLMNVMGCLDLPDSGRYILDGVDIAECSDKELSLIRSEKIGFVFQQFNLLDSMSALENVELPLIYQKCSQKERIERAKAALDKVGLYNRKQHRPSQLSGGQQQRVAIARALASNARVILADEPTGNLDSKSGNDIMRLICELSTQQHTIVLITHNQDVAQLAQRTVFVRDGMLFDTSEEASA